jgi:hypothetical protein
VRHTKINCFIFLIMHTWINSIGENCSKSKQDGGHSCFKHEIKKVTYLLCILPVTKTQAMLVIVKILLYGVVTNKLCSSQNLFVQINNPMKLYYKGWYESIFSNFFLRNIIAITLKFMWMIHTSFAIMRLFFLSLCHFQYTFASVE